MAKRTLSNRLSSFFAEDELEKSFSPAVSPGGVAMYAPPAQLAGMAGTLGTLSSLLARDPNAFGGTLGPAFPIGTLPLDPTNANGRADPRLWQYQVAWNLDLQGRLAQWNILASAAVQIDIFSRAIAIRSSDLTRMDWSWQISKDAITTIMEDNNVSNSEAAKIARQTYRNKLVELSEMWENPYPQMDMAWEEWITEANWQLLTYDGLPIHPRYNLGGEVIGFDIIDASTIKRLLDDEGGTPEPPNPAFQQILWGFPRGEFLASPMKGTTLYLGGEFKITDRDQLSYFVVNKRTNSPYGLSPVEMALQIGNVYVERLKWLQAEYSYGSTARGYFETDTTEMDQNNFADWQRIINNWFSGQTSTRQLLTALPKGFKAPTFTPQMDEKFKADFDEMLIKRTAGFFGVMPSQFGVVARAGLGGGKGAAEGEQDLTESVSSKPQNKAIERIVNSLARRYQGADRNVTFTLMDDEGSEDKVEMANALKTYYSFGALTANDVRRQLGEEEYEFAEADMPMIVTATGALPLKGLVDPATGLPRSIPPIGGPSDVNDQALPGAGDKPQGTGEVKDQDDQEGQKSGVGKEGVGEGEAASSGVDTKSAQADELRDLTAFTKQRTKRGNWRAFEFSTFPDDVAEALNEKAYFIVKGAKAPENLYGYFAQEVERLLRDSPKAKRKSLRNIPHVGRVAQSHKDAIVAGLAGATGLHAAITNSLGGQSVTTSVASAVNFPSKTLETTLTSLYQDAAEGGSASAADDFAVDAVAGGARLQALLAQVPATIKGLEDTTISRVETAVQTGVNAGESADEIAERIRSTVFGPMLEGQASTIAMTEANRAYGASYIDTAVSAGMIELNWARGGESDCPTCEENESNSPYPISSFPDFPAHPNCLCTPESVV